MIDMLLAPHNNTDKMGWLRSYQSTFLSLSQAMTWISTMHMSWSFLVFSVWRWEVIVCFVDIGGIVDHHCLYFVFVMITCHTLTSQSVIHCSFSEGVSFNLLISSSIRSNPKSFSGSSGSLVGAFCSNSSNLVTWKKNM